MNNEYLNVSGEWRFIYDDGTVIERKNIITQAGLNFLSSLFIAEQTNDVPFYLVMGTGTTLADKTDVKLEVETVRKIVSQKTRQNSAIRIRTMLQSGEANGDFTEFGIVVAGTQLKDSGILFNRLVTPVSKASNQILTVECKITIV